MNPFTRAWRWFFPHTFTPDPEYGKKAVDMLYVNPHPEIEDAAHEILAGPWKGDESASLLRAWVRDTIWYAEDAFGSDYWQKPEETLSRKRGDCEDKALLLRAMIDAVATGMDQYGVRFVVGTLGKVGHATVAWHARSDGEWYNYDPGTGLRPWLFKCDRMFSTYESAGRSGVWRHTDTWEKETGFWPR